MTIVLSDYLIDMATDVARDMREKGLHAAPIDQNFIVTSDISLARAYLGSITVDGTEYFVCLRVNSFVRLLNPTIRSTARNIARELLERGDPPERIYPIPVGQSFLYLSADRNMIVGPDTIHIDGTTFYLGFKR